MATHDDLLRAHGEGNCHICGKPKIAEGAAVCSYPHGMVPVKPTDPGNPNGFWIWGIVNGEAGVKP